MTTSALTSYAVLCEHCGKRIPKTIAWLTVRNDFPCDECGGLVNLASGDNAIAIQKFAQQCADLDAITGKRS